MLPYNKKLVSNAKALRKNMTPEEKHLWYDFLSKYPVRFQRQKAIDKFIADFYCHKAKLVIELDGSQHYTPEHQASDKERDSCLASWGISVLRYSNDSLRTNFDGVAQDILQALGLDFSDLKPPK